MSRAAEAEIEAAREPLVRALREVRAPTRAALTRAVAGSIAGKLEAAARAFLLEHLPLPAIADAAALAVWTRKAAVLILSIDSRTRVGSVLRAAARRAFRGYLADRVRYMDDEDLFEELRMKVWRAPVESFQAIAGRFHLQRWVTVAANHLALDIARRSSTRLERGADASPTDDRFTDANQPAEVALRDALRVLERTLSSDVFEAGRRVFLYGEDEASVLADLNTRRGRAGARPLKAESLRVQLWRFERRLRELVSGRRPQARRAVVRPRR